MHCTWVSCMMRFHLPLKTRSFYIPGARTETFLTRVNTGTFWTPIHSSFQGHWLRTSTTTALNCKMSSPILMLTVHFHSCHRQHKELTRESLRWVESWIKSLIYSKTLNIHIKLHSVWPAWCPPGQREMESWPAETREAVGIRSKPLGSGFLPLNIQWNPPGKGKAPHSRILAWEIPWAEEPGGLQSMGSHESDTT